LEDADLVKFAKFRPALDQARQIVVQVRHLVDITKPDRRPEDDVQYEIRDT
jgi:hypothetical protein